jgi:hypothetical protein
LIAAGIGLMAQPGNSYHLRVGRYPFYAADNGAFGGHWDEDVHLAWLDRLPRDRCLFAVAPDVYPDAVESQRRGLSYAPLLREMGFPVAVVAQDHAEQLRWDWEAFDVLFIGGERKKNPRLEWKTGPGAERLTQEARRHGLWCHMGRVNSQRRMERARQMGCNSADGTFIKYRRRRRAADSHADARDARGANEIDAWGAWLRANPTLPWATETPSHPTHRAVLLERA